MCLGVGMMWEGLLRVTGTKLVVRYPYCLLGKVSMHLILHIVLRCLEKQ